MRPLPTLAPLPSRGILELALPECEKGLGSLIHSADSADLIAGVRLQAQALWPDDRGYFLEIQRVGHGLVAGFPAASTQISAVFNYPNTIKAFHYHWEHTDCWTPATGLLQVALVDLRPASPTFGLRNTMFVGAMRPWHILIPPGVAHGYKVIGAECAVMIYLTDRFYDPKDEGRIAYDDPGINYDWEIQRAAGWEFPALTETSAVGAVAAGGAVVGAAPGAPAGAAAGAPAGAAAGAPAGTGVGAAPGAPAGTAVGAAAGAPAGERAK